MEDFGAIFTAISQNHLGILGTWVTLVMFFLRNEFNHRKLRNENENTVRAALMTRIEQLEVQGTAERQSCQLETKALRDELAAINQRFVRFQLAVVREMAPTKINGILVAAMGELIREDKEEASHG